MKTISRTLPAFLAAAILANSQEKTGSASGDFESVSSSPATARILGEISDGASLQVEVERASLQIKSRDIINTTTHEVDGQTIIIREIKPIALPQTSEKSDIHPEQAVVPAEMDNTASNETAESNILSLSATVYRSASGPSLSLVRWQSQGSLEEITFWSSADFGLIVGGIQSFIDTAGMTHLLLASWGTEEIESIADLSTNESSIPQPPVFTDGKATFQIIGRQPDANQKAAIQSLHDIYNSRHQELKSAYENRERIRVEQENDLKANPPPPKDIILNFWRMEKSTADGKGEGQ